MELRKPVILIVDDDPNDRFLMQTAFSNIGVSERVSTVAGGAEAIEYLSGTGQYADRNRFPFPNLLLLDLNMAKMNGFEFLRYIRNHPNLMVIPTIVFTSSEEMDDLKQAYVLGANSYLVKSKTFDGLCDQFKFIYGYWMRVRVPPIVPEGV
ncbi:MAG TPA: response regulator [Verrucomicrobiae bacterium]|jgi:CheY-like chemotaxis protein|nr:response regulator [Verrucomicrobiae bacterium]